MLQESPRRSEETRKGATRRASGAWMKLVFGRDLGCPPRSWEEPVQAGRVCSPHGGARTPEPSQRGHARGEEPPPAHLCFRRVRGPRSEGASAPSTRVCMENEAALLCLLSPDLSHFHLSPPCVVSWFSSLHQTSPQLTPPHGCDSLGGQHVDVEFNPGQSLWDLNSESATTFVFLVIQYPHVHGCRV